METSNNSVQKKYALISAPQCKAGGVGTDSVANAPKVLKESGIIAVIKACDAYVEDYGEAFEPDNQPISYEEENDSYDETQEDGSVHLAFSYWRTLSQTTEKLFTKVKQAIDNQMIPLVIGGDHGVATGSIAASLSSYKDLGIIWVDAHTDINTPLNSIHGNYHGMPVAHLLGIMKSRGFTWLDQVPKLNPKKIVYIALRSVYQVDKDALEKHGIAYYTMNDVCQMGIGTVMKEAVHKIDPDGNSPLHLSFDIDCCDPSFCPGTTGKIEGGLSYAEALYVCSFVNKTNRVVSMDFVELNLDLDLPPTVNFQSRLPIKNGIPQTVRLFLKLVSEAVMGKGIQTTSLRDSKKSLSS